MVSGALLVRVSDYANMHTLTSQLPETIKRFVATLV
jgi:hypothetical protein